MAVRLPKRSRTTTKRDMIILRMAVYLGLAWAYPNEWSLRGITIWKTYQIVYSDAIASKRP